MEDIDRSKGNWETDVGWHDHIHVLQIQYLTDSEILLHRFSCPSVREVSELTIFKNVDLWPAFRSLKEVTAVTFSLK